MTELSTGDGRQFARCFFKTALVLYYASLTILELFSNTIGFPPAIQVEWHHSDNLSEKDDRSIPEAASAPRKDGDYMEDTSACTPLVSVLVITYQQEDYIGRCIEGVIAQETDFPIELIVGTDCSSDNTDAIVRDYHRKYPDLIRPIFRESNIGALENSKSILRRARGSYIATCDGDDEWTDPKKLQKQVSLLEENPDVVLIYTDIDQYYVNSGKRVSCIQKRMGRSGQYPDPDAWFEAILLRKAPIHTATICARAKSLLSARQDVQEILDASPMGDTPTLLALTRYGRFVFLPESTALMNRLTESASRSTSYAKKVEFALGSIEMQVAVARRYNYSSDAFDRMLSRRALMVLRLCILDEGSNLTHRAMRSLAGIVTLTWLHYVLQIVAKNAYLSKVYRLVDKIVIAVRRRWRHFRYGIESST